MTTPDAQPSPCPQRALSPAGQSQEFIARAIEKLPVLNLFWSDELQALWWKCMESLALMAARSGN